LKWYEDKIPWNKYQAAKRGYKWLSRKYDTQSRCKLFYTANFRSVLTTIGEKLAKSRKGVLIAIILQSHDMRDDKSKRQRLN